MTDHVSSRRRFLAETGKLAGAGWLSLNAPMLLAAGKSAAEHMASGTGWENLAVAEARTLAAAVDQVIPPDDLPGAAEVGVVHFVDNVLGGFAADLAGPLKIGLRDLDWRAMESYGEDEGFYALPFDRQTAILEKIEDSPFFNSVIFLTHCGMFAMPAWGGNRDKAGWALLGFENLHAWQPPFGFYDAQAMEPGERT